MAKSDPLPVRFAEKYKLNNDTGCWEWSAAQNGVGYGLIRDNGRHRLAHRVSWCLSNGTIPDGLWVLHKCDVRNCCNPEHLFLGTAKDNMDDKTRKGRGRNGNSGKSHCVQGHPLSGDNLYIRPNGNRTCRECARVSKRRRRAQRTEARSE